MTHGNARETLFFRRRSLAIMLSTAALLGATDACSLPIGELSQKRATGTSNGNSPDEGAADPNLSPDTNPIRNGTGVIDRPSIDACKQLTPGRSPLRRLTRFEYNNTVRDLLGDTTSPASSLPGEETGNGFGNDADAISVSLLLAEQLSRVADDVATRATAAAALAKTAPCLNIGAKVAEDACARTFIDSFAARAYRRPLEADEASELISLYEQNREKGYTSGIAAVIEATLQSPDFLYRIETGEADAKNAGIFRPTGYEMASRLSYLFWGSPPDSALLDSAKTGNLGTGAGVLSQAKRLLDHPRSHNVVAFFFDNLLPLGNLSGLERDATLFPTFTPALGRLFRTETQRFLEHVIFEGSGDWRTALTAPFTFVNEPLAKFYKIEGVTGTEFRKVDTDASRRIGFLMQAGFLAGSTHASKTSPVVRGSYIVQKLLCRKIPLPTGELAAAATPPNPDSGKTARERYTQHSSNPVCRGCHYQMDPVGFGLENFDAVGAWRDTENGALIDASGSVPNLPGSGPFAGPVELAKALAASEDAMTCFTDQWFTFAYGRAIAAPDACATASLHQAFSKAGYNVRELLLALTQTDAFLYRASPTP
jgi:hypothetical protein